MTTRRWRLRIGRIAERDVRQIFLWTQDRFGLEQARRYREVIFDAIDVLAEGPNAPGSRDASEVFPEARILHVARGGHRGRHVILYRADGEVIRIGRVLHDAMDLARHAPGEDDWT